MAHPLVKRRFAVPTPKKAKGMTLATFLLSSEEICEGGHGLCHPLLVKRRYALLSSPKKDSVMTMGIFFLSSVESCDGILRVEVVCASYSSEEGKDRLKVEMSLTMAIFPDSSVESCGGDHVISSREEQVCLSSAEKTKE